MSSVVLIACLLSVAPSAISGCRWTISAASQDSGRQRDDPVSVCSGAYVMHGRIPADPQTAIFPADQLASQKVFSDRLAKEPENKWFSKLCDRLWKEKPAAALDHLTSAELHQCYRYAAGRQQPPAIVLYELLRGGDGERVLDQLMRGCKEPWWLAMRRARAASKAYDNAAEQLDLDLD